MFRRIGQAVGAYARNLLISLDQLLGSLVLGTPADMTISATAWLWRLEGRRAWAYRLIDALFFWEEGHCRQAYLSEVKGRQLPERVRGSGRAWRSRPGRGREK